MEIFKEVAKQIPFMFVHPMLYVGLLLMILQYKRQIALERKLFSSRLHSLSYEVIHSVGYGLIGGLIASGLLIGLGVVFRPDEMWLIWMISLILSLFHVRFLCLSYATGILGFFAGIFQWVDFPNIPWLVPFIDIINQIHIPSLIAIVAILHLVEAILIRLKSGEQATPLFVETKRGKLIGGYQIQSFWLLPLFLIISVGDPSQGSIISSGWWPLIGGAAGLSILPVPVMIGYSDLTTVLTTEEKSRMVSNYLMVYSLILLGMAFIAEYWLPFQIIAALFAALAHEGIRWIGKRKEKKGSSLYVHPPEQGLKVLAVIPGSLAERMGIKPGEVIQKVNGMTVHNRRELYDGLHRQAAFVKLEIINLAGQVKFAQHSIYDGDHHQLGIILAPDDDAPYYIEFHDINLFHLIKQQLKKITRGA